MFGGLVAVKQRGEGFGDFNLGSFVNGFSNGFLTGGSGAGPAPYYDPTLDPVYVSGGDPNQLPTYSTLPSVIASTPTITTTQPAQNNSATPGWIALLGGAEKVISNIFAPAQATVAQAEASRPVYTQSAIAPTVLRDQYGNPVQNIANTGASITNQLLGFVQQNPLTVGAIVVGIVLWKSGRK